MIRGGISDKLGNKYEAKWLVRNLIDVIAVKANWLKFEGVETEYRGFEFAISRGEITEWHQTKINSPDGNWTINALQKEGVLRAFSNRLSADQKSHCFFISQDNAKIFRTLTDKSRIANSYNQYLELLSRDQNDSIQRINEIWQQSNEDLFNWLRRSFVEIIPERELNSLIESFGDLYFQYGGKNIFPILRDILEENFNKLLSTEELRNIIKSQGIIIFKEWAFDPTIEKRLNDETDAYLETYTPFGAGGETIVRSQSKTLIEDLIKPDGAKLILLTGVAGAGKSGIIRDAITQARKLKIPLLAFRADHFLNCSTREELGKLLTGREESPVSTLKGTFTNTPTILFIDQVDAVSEVSGRHGQVKEVVFRLIKDAYNFGGVGIVVVCRSFDLDSDPRLKALKEAKHTKQIELPLFDWNEDVGPLLKNKGFDIRLLNEPQRKLLCSPINLSIFLEIDDRQFTFYSRTNLHEKLIEKKTTHYF